MMPTKKKPLTHQGVIVTSEGRKKVYLRRNATTWCSKSGKSFYINDGMRCGHVATRCRLLLDTIVELDEPIEQ